MRAAADPPDPSDRIRLDKWLWQARFYRSRSQAAAAVAAGMVRLNGIRAHKPGHVTGPGDTLTLSLPAGIRVVRVAACGTRRGPASEARRLYVDLSPGPDIAAVSPLE